MVKWSEFVASGSGGLNQPKLHTPTSGSIDAVIQQVLKEVAEEAENMQFDNTAQFLDGSSWRPIGVKNFNAEVYKKIRDVYDLAVSFDSSMEVVGKIHDIIIAYQRSAILTKDEMVFLNQMYKLLSFEAKYHKDKQTTIGAITTILGELNGKKD